MTQALYVEDNYEPNSNHTVLLTRTKTFPNVLRTFQMDKHTTHIRVVHFHPAVDH